MNEGDLMRRRFFRILAAFALAAGAAAPLAAQDQPPGIRLGAPYSVQRPLLAVRPFSGPAPIAAVLDSVTTIVQRDLANSSRYNMMASVPEALRTGEVDYRQWNGQNVVYLVTGSVAATARGYDLTLVIHDVVYTRVMHEARYAMPTATEADFRMAVHAISDEVVRRTVNLPGSAATRIAMARKNGEGNDDLLVVDSDGFGLRRIAGFGGQLYSPVWSPDARRILYTINAERGWQLVERDVRSGSQRMISPGGDMILSLAYAPDGRKIAMGLWQGDGAKVVEYDLAGQCCMKPLSGSGTNIDMYPSYSPRGDRMVFVSTRLGNPHVYVMPASGGSASLMSPYQSGQAGYYTAPAWSPTGNRIAFSGTWNIRTRGNYQIMLGDADRPGSPIEQVTTRGNNEDPSWAPDGRHLVYTSVGDGAGGLYIIDTESRTRRLLAPGANLRLADWSPVLVQASDFLVRP
jgi:TolB protein